MQKRTGPTSKKSVAKARSASKTKSPSAATKKRSYGGPDRRKWPRLERELPITVVRAVSGAAIARDGFTLDPMWTRDLGGAGLGLNAPVHCPIGSELEITFQLPGRDDKLAATVSVVYCKLESEVKKLYRVGVTYKNISEEERQAIIYYVNDNLP